MSLPETTPLKIAHLPLVKLVVPDFYEKLFFASGDHIFNYP
jgi:hypothetical protein